MDELFQNRLIIVKKGLKMEIKNPVARIFVVSLFVKPLE